MSEAKKFGAHGLWRCSPLLGTLHAARPLHSDDEVEGCVDRELHVFSEGHRLIIGGERVLDRFVRQRASSTATIFPIEPNDELAHKLGARPVPRRVIARVCVAVGHHLSTESHRHWDGLVISFHERVQACTSQLLEDGPKRGPDLPQVCERPALAPECSRALDPCLMAWEIGWDLMRLGGI